MRCPPCSANFFRGFLQCWGVSLSHWSIRRGECDQAPDAAEWFEAPVRGSLVAQRQGEPLEPEFPREWARYEHSAKLRRVKGSKRQALALVRTLTPFARTTSAPFVRGRRHGGSVPATPGDHLRALVCADD